VDSRYHPVAMALFELAFLPWRRRRVKEILLDLPELRLTPNRPLLLVANHVSWWDAFALREVHRRLRPSAPLYTLMAEAELARLPYFRLTGGIGIGGGAGGTLRGFRLLERRVRERPDSVVLFFPQGRIWPSHRRPLGFSRGTGLLASLLGSPVIVPAGIHLEPLASSVPTVFVSLGEPVDEGAADVPRLLEAAVEERLDGILTFLSVHGEDAPRAWPPRLGRTVR
jgi:1-acyl-sn-glycerol-3-phosphate acyltransferase